MKLYYSPGACSLAPHIALKEAGLTFNLESVNLETKKTGSGADFTKINPKGYVPALELPGGQLLTESVAIMQYIADQRPESGLMPKGGMERYRAQEWLNFVSTEIHKGMGALFNDKFSAETKDLLKANLGKRLDYLNDQVKGKQFVMGSQYTVVDGYLFTCLNWSHWLKFDLTKWPNVMGHLERVANRPATQAAMTAEGLNKK
jgi:glutathione S-transferase